MTFFVLNRNGPINQLESKILGVILALKYRTISSNIGFSFDYAKRLDPVGYLINLVTYVHEKEIEVGLD